MKLGKWEWVCLLNFYRKGFHFESETLLQRYNLLSYFTIALKASSVLNFANSISLFAFTL